MLGLCADLPQHGTARHGTHPHTGGRALAALKQRERHVAYHGTSSSSGLLGPVLSLLPAQVPGATSYMGCVGDDEFAQEMTKTAGKDGVNVSGGGWAAEQGTPRVGAARWG